MNMIDRQKQACVQECHRCHDRCLEMGGDHAVPGHIRLMVDCAEICQTSASFMLRMSNFHGEICGVCARVCEECARIVSVWEGIR